MEDLVTSQRVTLRVLHVVQVPIFRFFLKVNLNPCSVMFTNGT